MTDFHDAPTPTDLIRWLAKQRNTHGALPSIDGILAKWDLAVGEARRLNRSLSASPDMPETISPLLLEASLCVWEFLIERRWREADSEAVLLSLPAWDEMWDNWGSVHMRLQVTPIIAAFALRVYDAPGVKEWVTDDRCWSYAWEFIPRIVKSIKSFTNNGYPVLPDLDATVAALLADTA